MYDECCCRCCSGVQVGLVSTVLVRVQGWFVSLRSSYSFMYRDGVEAAFMYVSTE